MNKLTSFCLRFVHSQNCFEVTMCDLYLDHTELIFCFPVLGVFEKSFIIGSTYFCQKKKMIKKGVRSLVTWSFFDQLCLALCCYIRNIYHTADLICMSSFTRMCMVSQVAIKQYNFTGQMVMVATLRSMVFNF